MSDLTKVAGELGSSPTESTILNVKLAIELSSFAHMTKGQLAILM